MGARLLLVHSPLVGCGTWEPVARDLAGNQDAVTVSDLADAVAAGPLITCARLGDRRQRGRPARCARRGQPRGAAAGRGRDVLARKWGVMSSSIPAAGAGALLDEADRAAGARGPVARRNGAGPAGPRPPLWPAAAAAMGTLRVPLLDTSGTSGGAFEAGCPRLPLAMVKVTEAPAPGRPSCSCSPPPAQRGRTKARRARARGESAWPVTHGISDHLAPLAEPGLGCSVSSAEAEGPAGANTGCWRLLVLVWLLVHARGFMPPTERHFLSDVLGCNARSLQGRGDVSSGLVCAGRFHAAHGSLHFPL